MHLLMEDMDFMTELETWCEQRCDAFDLGQADEAHDLAHTKLHEEFCLLFEQKIEACLAAEGCATAEFWQKLTKAVDDDAPLAGQGFLLEALRACTDFLQFSVTMRGMRRDRAGK